MPIVSIVFGLALIGLGVWGYSTSDLEGNLKYTALIPAAVGAILLVCGALGMVERFLKHAMHLAAVVGLLGLILAAGRFFSKAKDGVDFSKTSTQAVLGMMGLCLVFVALCVNSFIQARRRRLNRPPAPPAA